MNVVVDVLGEKKEHRTLTLDTGATVGDAIVAAGFDTESVLPLKKNTPVPVDEGVSEGECLTLLPIISGG